MNLTDPLLIFLFSGCVSMSAALSAGALNKLPNEQRPGWLARPALQIVLVLMGNLAAVTLLAAIVFGFQQLTLWVTLLGIFITFPVVHLLLVQRLLGERIGLFIMMPLVLLSIGLLYYSW